jgi:hypothetical protein
MAQEASAVPFYGDIVLEDTSKFECFADDIKSIPPMNFLIAPEDSHVAMEMMQQFDDRKKKKQAAQAANPRKPNSAELLLQQTKKKSFSALEIEHVKRSMQARSAMSSVSEEGPKITNSPESALTEDPAEDQVHSIGQMRVFIFFILLFSFFSLVLADFFCLFWCLGSSNELGVFFIIFYLFIYLFLPSFGGRRIHHNAIRVCTFFSSFFSTLQNSRFRSLFFSSCTLTN